MTQQIDQVARQIARLTANCFTQTMEEECRRMSRLQELHGQFEQLGGDEDSLNAAIAREVRRVEQSIQSGEYFESPAP